MKRNFYPAWQISDLILQDISFSASNLEALTKIHINLETKLEPPANLLPSLQSIYSISSKGIVLSIHTSIKVTVLLHLGSCCKQQSNFKGIIDLEDYCLEG